MLRAMRRFALFVAKRANDACEANAIDKDGKKARWTCQSELLRAKAECRHL
jgi:hypothetical protein